MARQLIDHTGNKYIGSTFAKINANFAEVYAGTAVSSGTFTTLTATTGTITTLNSTNINASYLVALESIKLDTGTKTATSSAGAVTLNKTSGTITTEALTTIAGATYTLTITNSKISATSQVFASVRNGTNTSGIYDILRIEPLAGSVVISIYVIGGGLMNGTIKVSFIVLDE